MENIKLRLLHRSVKDVRDFLQTVLDNRLGPMPMFQYSDFLYINIFMVTNKIRPYQCDAHHGNESFDSFYIPHVRILDVKPRRFHGLEQRLNLPSFLVSGHSLVGMVEADENLKFRLSIGVLESRPGKIYIFPLHKVELMIEEFFSESDPVEQMACPYFLSQIRIDDPEVLPDTDVVADPLAVEPSDPFLADKLPVGNQTVYAVIPEEIHKLLNKKFAFLPIGVATLRQKPENQRECYPTVGYAEHEDIDVDLPEFPVGSVHGKRDLALNWNKAENHPCNEVKVQRILGEEPLESAHVGITLNAGWHGGSQFMETDSLNHAESMDDVSHQLYSGKIHSFSKMFLHNREDLVNFNQVPGISSFHGEKSPNFSFKLLIFRGLCKYNYLKFRCLTA